MGRNPSKASKIVAFIFHGEDNFSLREAVAELKAGLGDPSLIGLNTSILEGRGFTFAELQAHCETVPFLAPARLVIVEGLLSRFNPRTRPAVSGGDSAEGRPPVESAVSGGDSPGRGREGEAEDEPEPPPDPAQEKPAGIDGGWFGLPALLERMPPTTTLVFIEDGALNSRNPMLRSIGKLAEHREFRPLRGAPLLRWIEQRVGRAGGGMTPGAVRLLADLVGDNLWSLASEIDKLTTYALGRTVTEQDVTTLTIGAREASIFTLVDAIIGRNLRQASRTLQQLLDEGSAPPYVLFMIARQVRALLLAKDLLEANRRLPTAERVVDEEIGRRIGVTHPYALRKTLDQARGAAAAQLAAAHHRLLEADLSLKTGRMDGDLAAELLVVDLCRAGAAGAGVR